MSDSPKSGSSAEDIRSNNNSHSEQEEEERTSDVENDYSEEDEGGSEKDGKVVKPLTKEDLEEFNAAQERTGVVYISRIPPGMRPTKVRHLMSAYGEVGRVYLQQEGKQLSVKPLFLELNPSTRQIRSEHIYAKNTLQQRRRIIQKVGSSSRTRRWLDP